MTCRKKILLAVALLAALVSLTIVVMHFRAKWRLENYKKQLIAAGEKLSIAELIPQKRTESNSLALFVEVAKSPVFGLPGPKPMQFSEKGPARVAWRQPQWSFLLSENQTTNILPSLERDAETNRSALSRLSELLIGSAIYMEPDYERGFEMRVGLSQEIRTVAEELSTAVLLNLHRGEKEEALRNLRAAIAIERIFTNEPSMFFQTSRSRNLHECFALCWEALQFSRWTDEELGQLQRDWESVNLLKQMEPSIGMERACVEQVIGNIHEGPLTEPVEQCVCGGCVKDPSEQPPLWLWKWIWSYDEEQEILKFYLEELQWIRANAAHKTVSNERAELVKHDWTRRLISYWAPMIQYVCAKQVATQTEIEMVITAIALARFHLAEGHYPDSLRELRPGFLQREPEDFCDGKPLRYRRNPDGTFLLYSVGRDGIDNGGITKHYSFETIYDFRDCLDMVWPQAQPDSEAQADEEKKFAREKELKEKAGRRWLIEKRYGIPDRTNR